MAKTPVVPFSAVRSLLVPRIGAAFSDVSSEVSHRSTDNEANVIEIDSDSDSDSDSQRETTPVGKG